MKRGTCSADPNLQKRKKEEVCLLALNAISWEARVKNPELPKTVVVRVIQYQRKGFRPQRLMTSLVDAEQYPAKEIVEVYHERWEIELSYREVKTEMLEGSLLRSKEPKRVCQEIWGLLIAYNLIRLEMQRVAKAANVSPLRISFVAACHLICNEWLWCAFASPGSVPRHLLELAQQLSLFILPPRRSRWYPRKVKSPYGRYPRKSPREKGKRL